MPLRAAEIETLFTANTQPVEKAEKDIKSTGQRIEKNPITAKVDAKVAPALAGLLQVENGAERIRKAKTAATIDANIERAESQLTRVVERLDYLRTVEPTLEVGADIKRAEAQLQKVQRNLEGLRSVRATIEVDADASQAVAELDELRRQARTGGKQAGEDAGAEVESGIMASLAALPIAGAIVGVGIVAGKALARGIEDGLQVEVGFDRLAALTGLDEAAAQRIGRGAGEAYANVFGQSIAANMDTARIALQSGLLDETSTSRDSQRIVQGLSGIADVLGEEVQPVARAVTQLLRTGLARSADEAFDILATGAREGVNIGEDLLDTYNEYSTQFRKLGIDGPQSLGLLNQALRAGARDSDIAADALKEFAIRATDPAYAEAFNEIGFSWEELSGRIAAGGPDAAAALDETLDKIRAIEDPAARSAAAMTIFGTQAEDMAAALNAMDLTTAVDELNGVEGAAQRMFDTLANNDATKIEQARRNIEVAFQGIQGAAAAAFAEPLTELADFVSENRGPLTQFLLDLANGALDFGDAMLEAVAAGTEGFGDFVSGPLAETVDALANFIDWTNGFEGRPKELDELAESMRGFSGVTDLAADSMRENLGGAIDDARTRLNDFGEPVVAMGYLNDASLRLAESIGQVGSESGTMEEQVRAAVAALSDEVSAADAAGESQENLRDRYAAGTQALLDQMIQSGLTREEAQALIDTVLSTPVQQSTTFDSNARDEQAKVQSLADRIVTLPDGSVIITADTTPARNGFEGFIQSATGRRIAVYVDAYGGRSYQNEGSTIRYEARGDILEFMASGGIRGAFDPMPSIAQMVSPNTYRVVGDRGDVDEAYIPLDRSARSMAILLEAMRRMGVMPMADGGLAQSTRPSTGASRPAQVIQYIRTEQTDPRLQARAWGREAERGFASS